MGLNIGTSPILDLFLGTIRPQAVYLGSALVWPVSVLFDIVDAGSSSDNYVGIIDAGSSSVIYPDILTGGSS